MSTAKWSTRERPIIDATANSATTAAARSRVRVQTRRPRPARNASPGSPQRGLQPTWLLGSVNAGFDSDLSAWDMFMGTKEVGAQWSSDDADGCPYSGSFKVAGGMGEPIQCVAVSPGTYNVGGWFKNTDGAAYLCEYYAFRTADCTGETSDSTQILGNDTTWTFRTTAFQISAGSKSVLVQCGENTNSFYDKLFLSKGGF